MYNDRGYLIDNGKRVHREVMRPLLLDALEELFPNETWVVHHRDGNKTNNDIFNLEVMKNEEHSRMHNYMDLPEHRNKRIRLKYPGATLQKNRNPEGKCWKCEIRWNGKTKYIGMFHDPLSASMIYKFIRGEFDGRTKSSINDVNL